MKKNIDLPLFTVFTPTYNREKFLHRVYESLQKQTFTNFEWLIIDDGSTDNTEEMVKQWQNESDFIIRYIWQENGHKKTAFNHAVRLAKGEFFLPADSDDTFPSNALEIFYKSWLDIPEIERSNFQGVCGLCQDEKGELIGEKFPGDDWIDSNSLEMRFRYRNTEEKWGFNRVDILRMYPFPENIPGHVPENVVWSRISDKYKTRYINKIVRVYHFDAGDQISFSNNLSKNAVGALYDKKVALTIEIKWFKYSKVHFILEAVRWSRFLCHAKLKLKDIKTFLPESMFGKLLITIFSPLGITWSIVDRLRFRK